MQYPAKFARDRKLGGYVVTFPDVPEAITQGDTLAEAMLMAQEALDLALTFYTEASKEPPVPGPGDRTASRNIDKAFRRHAPTLANLEIVFPDEP